MADLKGAAEPASGNPFHFNPATPEEFVGRWPLVREMAAELNAGQLSYACIGGRRFGKTSLFVVLRDMLWHPTVVQSGRPVLPLLLDPMIAKFVSTDHFFATLLYEVRRRCDTRLPDPPGEPRHIRVPLDGTLVDELLSGNPPAITAAQFAEVMNAILDRLEGAGGPRRLIILLDEVDSLLDYPWHKDLFAQLRASLVSGDLRSRLRLVLAGSQRFLEEATDRGLPLWNMLTFQYLTALDESSTYELAVRADGLSEAVRQAVWQQSAGHPFLARYLLHHLWKAASTHVTVADVAGLADQFMQQGATHLEGWSKAIGLAGLQIYGLFVDTIAWIERRAIVRAVSDPKVPVVRSLTALCYHGLIIPNPTWSQYRRGGDLFLDWYVQEVPRLIAELTPPGPTPLASPPFWIQLISNGPLQTVFEYNKKVTMSNKYDFSRASFSDSILNIEANLSGAIQTVGTAANVEPSTRKQLQALLEELHSELKQVPPDKASNAEAVATLANQAVSEATKAQPNKTLVQITGAGLKQAAENIGAVMPKVLEIAGLIVAAIGKFVV